MRWVWQTSDSEENGSLRTSGGGMGRYIEAWTVNKAQSKSLIKPRNTFSF